MIKIWPYRDKSRSARRLAGILRGRVLKLDASYSPFHWDVIINWGSSSCPYQNENPARVLNSAEAVKLASNKRNSFRALQEAGVRTPRFAFKKADVLTPEWSDIEAVVVRHKLTGYGGEGIEIVNKGEELPEAPLYVEYVKKEDEYRVHIVGEEVILVQRKARDRSNPSPNWKIRNHRNGFVFARYDGEGRPIEAPEQVVEQSKRAIKALNLDFGAVDVLWNRRQQSAYVLEINTAPGMEGSTINDYAEGIKKLLDIARKG